MLSAVIGAVGGYTILSAILFRFPNILHKKKTMPFVCRHISHRGGAGENLENTIAAFDYAISIGTDMLELDVQLTKDGQVVVAHDAHLFRSAGVDRLISDTNYMQLPALKTILPVDFDGGVYCQGSDHQAKIPLLSEVFSRYPTMPMNVDIKEDNDHLIQKVSDMVVQFNRVDRTVWGNVNDVVARKCYKQNSDIPLFFSSRGVLKLILLCYTGLLPFIPIKESCLETYMITNSARIRSQAKSADRSLFMIAIWCIEKLILRKALLNHLKRRGIQTYVWVLNYEEDFERAFRVGATGVMTDYPTKLRQFIDCNPELIK